jgi:TRAP-type transport system periplasmic protein
MRPAVPVHLNVSHYMPPDHGTHVDFIAPWARDVETASGGALSITVHTGESPLGLLDNQYDQVASGKVDVAHSPSGLPAGRFPRTLLLNLPFMTSSAGQGTRMLWELLDRQLAAEYAEFQVLALHCDSGGVLHTRDGPVTCLEQLAGLRLRCPAGPMEAALRCLGAIPVPLTPPKIRAAAEAGEIDGAMMAWDVVAYTGIAPIFRFHTDTKLYASPLYFVMNRARWQALPADLQRAVTSASGPALIERFGAWWQGWEAPGRACADAPGQVVTRLPAGELERWRQAAAPAIEDHVDRLTRAGVSDARDVYEAALALRSKYQEN